MMNIVEGLAELTAGPRILGHRVVKGAPHSVLDIAHSRPPWDARIERLIAKPSPTLPRGVKSLSVSSGSPASK